MNTVLIIEDDPDVADTLQTCIQSGGYTCYTAATGAEGLALCKTYEPTMIILDIGLPDINGLEVCARIRESKLHHYPHILMLTARQEEADELVGFATGASDYQTKPFSLSILMQRVQAVFRSNRHSTDLSSKIILHPHLRMYLESQEVSVRPTGHNLWRRISLSSLEFKILHLMAKQPHIIWSSSVLFSRFWENNSQKNEQNCVESCIKRIRASLKGDTTPHPPKFIYTIPKEGYKFVDDDT